jgi:hypothetical protein
MHFCSPITSSFFQRSVSRYILSVLIFRMMLQNEGYSISFYYSVCIHTLWQVFWGKFYSQRKMRFRLFSGPLKLRCFNSPLKRLGMLQLQELNLKGIIYLCSYWLNSFGDYLTIRGWICRNLLNPFSLVTFIGQAPALNFYRLLTGREKNGSGKVTGVTTKRH